MDKALEMLSAANTTISYSPNATVDQTNAQFNIYQRDSGGTKKKIGSLIKKGIAVIKNKYKDIERRKVVCQWNEALNLDLENDYFLQELSLTAIGEKPGASRTTSTAELMDVLIREKNNRILLEGDFSTGKTTFCRYLFYRWMCGKDLQSYTLVMWLPLRHMRGKSILEGMLESFKEMGKVVNVEFKDFENFVVSKSERILLLLDGLDETGKKEQEEILEMLRRNRFPHLSILATSRPIPEHIPLDCSRYIAMGVSERCVNDFLRDLGVEIAKNIELKISYDILRRPLLLKFIGILARNREQFVAFSTSYHVYERMLLYMIKNLTEKYPDKYNSKNKKIAEVAESFLNPLEEIAFNLLARNTLMIEKHELMNCHKLTDGLIEDQRKLGLLAFYTKITEDGLDEEEVCEFPLKPFAEILAMRHVKKLLVGGGPRVKDLSHLLRPTFAYRCFVSRDKLMGGIEMENGEITYYLFALLDDHADICLKVYQYLYGLIICNCHPPIRFSQRHGDFKSGNVIISVLAALTGPSKLECCIYFSKFSEIHLYGSVRNYYGSSLFEVGLMSLIENNSNIVPIWFHSLNSLLWTAYLFAEKFYPLEFKIRRTELTLNFDHLTDESAERLLDLPQFKDILVKFKKRVRIEFLGLEIRTRKFTARGMKAIELLIENLSVIHFQIALDNFVLSELRLIRSLYREVAKRTKLEFRYENDFRVLWQDGDCVHSVSFSNFEGPLEFKRCDVCLIGGKYDFSDITNSSSEVVPSKESVENFAETTSLIETSWEGEGKHVVVFAIKFLNIDEVLRCTCGGAFSRDFNKEKDSCYCGRRGFVNESGWFMIPLKCLSCGNICDERCCELNPKITCPRCHRLLQDSDLKSSNFLNMACDLVTFEKNFLIPNSMDEFDCCPSCMSRTRQVLKCPGCSHDFDVCGTVSNSPLHVTEGKFYICCTHCNNLMIPGFSCRTEECEYFGVGFASMSAREWKLHFQT